MGSSLFPPILIILVSVPLIFEWIPRNGLYGFRTPRTLESDAVWYPANKKAVDCMLRWSVEQGLSHRAANPEDLFAPGTMQDL